MEDVKKILSKLTLEEKCLLLTGKDFWETQPLKKLDFPSINVSDGPFGVRKVVKSEKILDNSLPATCFPTSTALSSTWNVNLVRKVGSAIAIECIDQDVDVILGPGLNIKRSPLCGRNFEYFSEDPYLSGTMAAAFVKGVQQNGVGACLKHFVANNQEELRLTMNSIVDERAMREIYAKGFEIAIKDSNPMMVMCSYNQVNGKHVSRNSKILNDLLRKELGFNGLVVSDWGAVVNIVDSIKAGLNLEMPGGFQRTDLLLKAVKRGELTREQIEDAITPLLKLMIDKKCRDATKKVKCDYDKHHKMAIESAEESAILLKNDENILPLKEGKKLAILGSFAQNPRIQGAGSSKINPTKKVTILEVLDERGIKYEYAPGYDFEDQEPKELLIKEAQKIAKGKDYVVIFVGLPESIEAEGYDRKDILMPKSHIALIEQVARVNKNVIVVLTAGAPISVSWEKNVKAILHTHLMGQAFAEATLNLLFGKANPSGKLNETYPFLLEDNPSYNYFGKNKFNIEYRESIFVGYRYYEIARKQVQYPFGYGLSYSKFSYRNLKLNKDKLGKRTTVTVSVDVKNISKIKGKEIVQLYIGQRFPIIFKPVKELKRYNKIELNPGETKTVKFTLRYDDFTHYDTELKQFIADEGTYTIYVGSNLYDVQSRMVTVLSGDPKAKDYMTNAKEYYKLDETDQLDIPFREFEAVYGKEIHHVYPTVKRPFTLNNTLNEASSYRSTQLLIKKLKEMAKDLSDGDKENEEMVINSFLDIPFRSMVSLSSGAVSHRQVQGILDFINGKYLRGLIKIASKRKK